jgi:putative transposase
MSGRGASRAFPIQEDEHLLTVLRYVLMNPCRAGLTQHAWEWQWSSLRHGLMVTPWPVEPPGRVSDWLRTPCSEEQEAQLRRSLTRGSPFGDEDWKPQAAQTWGLESTIRRRGRPKKTVQAPAETAEFQF